MQQLLQNLTLPKRKERSAHLLKECLPDRMNDDNPDVVAALLTLPTTELVEMLGPKSFGQTLCVLLRRAQRERETKWSSVVPQAVQHLTTSSVSDEYDTNLLLLALMPYLFPSEALNKREHAGLLIILNSSFATKLPFLGELNVTSDYATFNLITHRQQFLDVISSAGQPAQQQQALLKSVEEHGGVAFLHGQAHQLTHLLLLLTAYSKRELSAAECLEMLENISKYTMKFEFRVNPSNTSNHVPLKLYVDFLQTLVRNTKFVKLSTTRWTKLTDELRLSLRLLDTFSSHVFGEHCAAAERKEWARALKGCLNEMLPHPQHKLDFLCNFYVYETLPELYPVPADYALLRVRGFRLLQAVLSGQKAPSKCSLMHVLRIANACNSPLQTLRQEALATLEALPFKSLEGHVNYLVKSLLQRKSELGMDHEQYALILHTILQTTKCSPREELLLSKLKRNLLQFISDVKQPAICTAALLKALKHMNNESLLVGLLPLGVAMLGKITSDEVELAQLQWPYSDIYSAVIGRFEGSVGLAVLSQNEDAWKLIEASFKQHTTYVQLDQKLQPLPCVLLNALTPDTFNTLQGKHKMQLLNLIVQAATASDNDSIFLAAHRLLKQCSIECQPLITMLGEMCSKSTRQLPERRRGAVTIKLDLTSEAWKQGMTLLELLEHKRLLVGAEQLIPSLFELLALCLTLEENSAAAEYPKQLILSNLLHSCDVAQDNGVQLAKALPESCFRIEQVVQCLRNTQNPQTQQHALLFLTRCADLYPQQVLHKIVEIFTFVGSTVARHDDAFSLHIIRNVVTTIIPTLLIQPAGREDLVIPVLKVFADICTDVPVHRRLPLYETLFSVLDPCEHLWQFLCIVFEAQMLLEQKPQKGSVKLLDKSRVEFVRELAMSFDNASVILKTCVHLLDYLAKLPTTKEAQAAAGTAGHISPEQQLFDVRTRNFKQLRHYKYLIMDFLSGLSSLPEFQAKLCNPKGLQLPLYQDFILSTLAYVGVVNNALQAAAGTPSLEKYWRVLANHVHDVLDNAIGLLSPEYFINVITELLHHELIPVRIKGLELLVTKLAPPGDYFTACPADYFGVLFAPLGLIIDDVLDAATSGSAAGGAQQAQLQQTALHALQLLANSYGRNYLDECRELLAKLTRITKRRANVPKAVVGNVVLTLVEICGSIKAHALSELPKFAPQLTELLKEQVQQLLTQRHTPDYLCSALMTGELPSLLGTIPQLTTLLLPSSHAQTLPYITPLLGSLPGGHCGRLDTPLCAAREFTVGAG